jgi:hypothetical protein
MEINFVITEKEIIDIPNNLELGKYVRKKFWDIKENIHKANDDNLFVVNNMMEAIKSNKLIEINKSYVTENGFDKCVICGKETPYKVNESIHNRIGYVEGAGQTCFQPNICKNN